MADGTGVAQINLVGRGFDKLQVGRLDGRDCNSAAHWCRDTNAAGRDAHIGTSTIGTVRCVSGCGLAGAISGFINNVIYGLTLSPISTVYAITSIGIGIAVGVLHANGWFSSARRVFVSAIIIAIVSAVISTPLNVIFWGGQTGIAWGDSLFAVMVANHAPVWLASFTDEFVLDILDKVCVAYLAFFIYRQLPQRMVHFFRDDK